MAAVLAALNLYNYTLEGKNFGIPEFTVTTLNSNYCNVSMNNGTSYDQWSIIWPMVHHMTNGTSYDQWHIIRTMVHHMTNGTSYDQWHIIWPMVHHMTNGTSYDQWHIIWPMIHHMTNGTSYGQWYMMWMAVVFRLQSLWSSIEIRRFVYCWKMSEFKSWFMFFIFFNLISGWKQ